MKDIVTTIGKGLIGLASYGLAQAQSLLSQLPEWLRDPTKDLGYIIAILTIISLGHDVLRKYFGVDFRLFRRRKQT